MSKYQNIKKIVRNYFEDLEQCSPRESASVLEKYTSGNYYWEGAFPFLDIRGSENVASTFWKPLKKSLKNMQRRQDVFMAGKATDDKLWVMSMGHFMGLFDADYLNIRRTGKIQHLQYAEFSRVESNKIVHSAMFLDLIGFMKEAGCYPLPPETGHYFVYPGPKDHNGLMFEDAPYEKAGQTKKIIDAMIKDLTAVFDTSGNSDTEKIMQNAERALANTWLDNMIWYGPCGIGASYTIGRYHLQHQYPFCAGFTSIKTRELKAYFAEGDFACFYSSLDVCPKGGFLGLPGNNKTCRMRGDIDIYYCKNGKISENWCFIDLPFWLNEQGVNIFSRTARILNPSISDY